MIYKWLSYYLGFINGLVLTPKVGPYVYNIRWVVRIGTAASVGLVTKLSSSNRIKVYHPNGRNLVTGAAVLGITFASPTMDLDVTTNSVDAACKHGIGSMHVVLIELAQNVQLMCQSSDGIGVPRRSLVGSTFWRAPRR